MGIYKVITVMPSWVVMESIWEREIFVKNFIHKLEGQTHILKAQGSIALCDKSVAKTLMITNMHCKPTFICVQEIIVRFAKASVANISCHELVFVEWVLDKNKCRWRVVTKNIVVANQFIIDKSQNVVVVN